MTIEQKHLYRLQLYGTIIATTVMVQLTRPTQPQMSHAITQNYSQNTINQLHQLLRIIKEKVLTSPQDENIIHAIHIQSRPLFNQTTLRLPLQIVTKQETVSIAQ